MSELIRRRVPVTAVKLIGILGRLDDVNGQKHRAQLAWTMKGTTIENDEVAGELHDRLIFWRRVYAAIVNCKIYQDQRGRHNSGGLLSRWYEAWRPDSA